VLATMFGNTTEKVWAVIYGEIYCNLSPDADRVNQIGSLIYGWYDQSLSKNGNSLSIDLTENAQGVRNGVLFESQFEQTFLMGAIAVRNEVLPLSIAKLISIRKLQISVWGQKRLPDTELVRRQQAILAAGHFDAYNYWLFRNARPQEFIQWTKGHGPEYQAWLDWQKRNEFRIHAPDFQRLFMLRNPPPVPNSNSRTAPVATVKPVFTSSIRPRSTPTRWRPGEGEVFVIPESRGMGDSVCHASHGA
jgi:hypothetical protein